MRPDPADLQKCLRSRSHFLRRLHRPRRKCELSEELDESRSTIDRALRELEAAGFVRRDEPGYRTTLAGELALADYDRYAARLDGIAEFQDALSSLPTDEPLDAALFEDADVSLPTQLSPHEPIDALEAVLADADHACVVGSAIVPKYVELYRKRIVGEGMTADFVLSDAIVERLLSQQPELLASMVEASGVTLAETTTDWAFSLVVTEHESVSATDPRYAQSDRSVGVSASSEGLRPSDRSGGQGPREDKASRGSTDSSVGVMLYDEGTLIGFVHNDTREAVAWGEALFDRAADEAVELGVPVE